MGKQTGRDYISEVKASRKDAPPAPLVENMKHVKATVGNGITHTHTHTHTHTQREREREKEMVVWAACVQDLSKEGYCLFYMPQCPFCIHVLDQLSALGLRGMLPLVDVNR